MSRVTIHPVAVKLDSDTNERVKRLAEARHRTPHWVMREAILQYVDREEKREAFRQDGIRAWNEYQATGLHVTLEEADAWLDKLEAGQDGDPPECHV
ncbi:MAG TPA: CopG family ribbon-helix-helix protein [Spirochaetia bacterium]|nr:CopG family ribbon-helix-helix protein [Spirochaetia bacterium]